MEFIDEKNKLKGVLFFNHGKKQEGRKYASKSDIEGIIYKNKDVNPIKKGISQVESLMSILR